MARSDKYPPELMEPIYVGRLYELLYGHEAAKDQVFDLRIAKLKLLLKHFGIDERGPNPFLVLAFELALKHVKGFGTAPVLSRRPGRPKTRNTTQKYELFKEIAALTAGGRLSVNAACMKLAKDKSSQWHKKSWRTLANMWRETKKEVDGFESLSAVEKEASAWSLTEIERLRQIPSARMQQKSRRD